MDDESADPLNVLWRDGGVVEDQTLTLKFRHVGGLATLLRSRPGSVPPLSTPPGGQVHGVLYRLDSRSLAALTAAASRGGYRVQQLSVTTYGGASVTASVLVSQRSALLKAEVAPPEAYMRLLRDGAAEQFLSPHYQAWLSSIETVPSVGLPPAYWDTPGSEASRAFAVAATAVAVVTALVTALGPGAAAALQL
ncbi:hypothetical protein FOA52_002954 [Chlamydomonas sp. UWO 241]|nr:hypothetical protein FOA52_002954 [Chlamydomonas sp. UWO 241]